MIRARGGSGRRLHRCAGRRRVQRIDRLESESLHAAVHQVAADHALGQPLLVFLVEHSAAALEVRLAALGESIQGHTLLGGSPLGVPDAHDAFAFELDLPDAGAAIAAELLEHAGAAGEPRGQFLRICAALR